MSRDRDRRRGARERKPNRLLWTLPPPPAMIAPTVPMRFPAVRFPNRIPMRRHRPSAVYPSPAASIQVPKAVRPNISWTRCVPNSADSIGSGWRGHAIRHVPRSVSAAASHQRGGCKKNSRENCRFDTHRNHFSSSRWMGGTLRWVANPERSVTLRPVHLLRNRD